MGFSVCVLGVSDIGGVGGVIGAEDFGDGGGVVKFVSDVGGGEDSGVVVEVDAFCSSTFSFEPQRAQNKSSISTGAPHLVQNRFGLPILNDSLLLFSQRDNDMLSMYYSSIFRCGQLLLRKLFDNVLSYFEGFDGFPGYEIVGAEKEFNSSIAGERFVGIIDLMHSSNVNPSS